MPKHDRHSPMDSWAGAPDIVIADDQAAAGDELARRLRGVGCGARVATTFEAAGCAIRQGASHLVTELRVNGVPAADFLKDCGVPLDRCAVVTAYPSVATAVRFTRMGLAGYFAKPACVRTVVDALTGRGCPPEEVSACAVTWPSLDRTIWEYLNQVWVMAGSLSAAARCLGIDRRSLRRMLAKYPPRL